MHLQESGEMYLETIYRLTKTRPSVRAIDVCEHMGFSKPSVSRAIGLLKAGGFVEVDENGHLSLTPQGTHIAERTFECHTLLKTLFIRLGVDEETGAVVLYTHVYGMGYTMESMDEVTYTYEGGQNVLTIRKRF